MTPEEDRALMLRAKATLRKLHELNDRLLTERAREGLMKLGELRDALAVRQAFGLSYWFGDATRFPDLAEDPSLKLFYLAPGDMPSSN